MAANATESNLASSASVDAKPAPVKKSGFDPLRPVRYAIGFTQGTVFGTMDTMSNWGRKGSKIGAAMGLLVLISGAASGGLALIPIGWAMGLAGGAIAGGTAGLVTGGVKGVGREQRKDKYADDIVRRERAKSLPLPKTDYRAAHREYKRRDNYNYDRYLQQQRENNSDYKTYYQDAVRNSRSNSGFGQGF